MAAFDPFNLFQENYSKKRPPTAEPPNIPSPSPTLPAAPPPPIVPATPPTEPPIPPAVPPTTVPPTPTP